MWNERSASRLRRTSVSIGPPPSIAYARSPERSSPISVAARRPLPATSPITTASSPDGQRQRVVPVAADLDAGAGQEARRQLEPLDRRAARRAAGCAAASRRSAARARRSARARSPAPRARRPGRAGARSVLAEAVELARGDVQDADDLAVERQRDAGHRARALAQVGAVHLDLREVGAITRALVGGGDPARDARRRAARGCRPASTSSPARPRRARPARSPSSSSSSSTARSEPTALGDDPQHLVEQVVEAQVAQPGGRDRLEVADAVRRRRAAPRAGARARGARRRARR